MKLVTINSKLFSDFKIDPEFLRNARRPAVLILNLTYKGTRYNFAVPIRSNIPAASNKAHYFALPPRSTTRPGNRHGLHYIKMFPIKKGMYYRFRTEGNEAATLYKHIIDCNEKLIVSECQQYLNEYEKGNRHPYSTNIDLLISLL